MIARAVFFVFCFTYISAKVWQLNCDQIRQFVDGHNSRRLLVAKGLVPNQPPAVTMHSMVWNEELATKAANWAAQNTFEHNPNRNIPSNKFITGENLYIFDTTAKNYKLKIDDALEAWFLEHKDFRYKPMTISDFSGIVDVGHYTQMIWSSSVYVGCAVSEFKDGKWNSFLVVCNYGPAGNVITQTPYQSGKGRNALTCGAETCSQPYGRQCSSGQARRLRARARAQARAQNRNRI